MNSKPIKSFNLIYTASFTLIKSQLHTAETFKISVLLRKKVFLIFLKFSWVVRPYKNLYSTKDTIGGFLGSFSVSLRGIHMVSSKLFEKLTNDKEESSSCTLCIRKSRTDQLWVLHLNSSMKDHNIRNKFMKQ